jgi:hypothetical protein
MSLRARRPISHLTQLTKHEIGLDSTRSTLHSFRHPSSWLGVPFFGFFFLCVVLMDVFGIIMWAVETTATPIEF